MANNLLRLCLLIGMLTTFGCTQSKPYDAIATHPVTGTVHINGVPAQGALVRFWPQTVQPGVKYPISPVGKVDASGTYQLTSYEGPDGAPLGEYVVTITWPDPDWRPPGGGMPPPPPDRLLGKFGDSKKPVLKFTVVDGQNNVDPIVLDNAKILEGSKLPSASN
ncbi:carboxypeptidase regulatory-like domain-containing protein [Bremerella sp. JC817]|uniref:carboxypeptidase regulatory-like domain-containing protein n=1 Tax=Bremerella sp. JC817 TaxID=3231756 RepID=UPI003459A0FB